MLTLHKDIIFMPFSFNKNFINFKIISYTFTYISAKINII